MNQLIQSGWKLSVYVIATMLGTFIGIFIVLGELNLTFMLIYLAVIALIVAGNAIYIVLKRNH
ncbi:hypothetical protein JMA_09680 [Jeotgalibacillus malaysiensis]|uniref:Uncharacterized protein n=1 Tax=Jeotgalibacillus malaysiensis TaxID=1508404 RepID=A0A0B5AIU2_9BACL|nr:hypothetical protein [Jeotgalibacillus malaysiensis]AJD90285.1 hypothetical protein JMA_09680 [Jeotgalibacillus malaysiensis]